MIKIFINMQTEETSNHAKKSNETKTIAVKRKRRPKNTTKKTAKRPATPSNALNPACVLSATDSFHHDSIQNNVTKRKKKRSKSTKKKNGKNTLTVKSKDAPAQPAQSKPKSNLKSSIQVTTDIVTKHSIKSFDRPRQRNNSTVESKICGADVVGLDEVIPQNIARSDYNKTQKEVHNKNIAVAVTDKVQVAWEHFALLIEEFMLAKDVRM